MKLTAKLFGMILTMLMLLTTVKADAATDWNAGVIRATGMGVPTTGAVGAQARMLARRAAVADAYRQLLELTEGVQVDSETTSAPKSAVWLKVRKSSTKKCLPTAVMKSPCKLECSGKILLPTRLLSVLLK